MLDSCCIAVLACFVFLLSVSCMSYSVVWYEARALHELLQVHHYHTAQQRHEDRCRSCITSATDRTHLPSPSVEQAPPPSSAVLHSPSPPPQDKLQYIHHRLMHHCYLNQPTIRRRHSLAHSHRQKKKMPPEYQSKHQSKKRGRKSMPLSIAR